MTIECMVIQATPLILMRNFIHLHHDHRMYGDTGYPIDPNEEVVIFGSRGHSVPCKFSDQDHERW